jgi:hypothetical protein
MHGTPATIGSSASVTWRPVGPPVILPHAEYAIVDVRPEGTSVDLRRVALDRRALAAQLDGWDNPLAAPLRAQYAS